MSVAVEKVLEHVHNAKGTRFSPEDLPFRMVHEDFDFGRAKWGHRALFVFEVPLIVGTQTPRNAYVAIVAVVHPEEGINSPEEWQIYEVEKHTRTVVKWEKK